MHIVNLTPKNGELWTREETLQLISPVGLSLLQLCRSSTSCAESLPKKTITGQSHRFSSKLKNAGVKDSWSLRYMDTLGSSCKPTCLWHASQNYETNGFCSSCENTTASCLRHTFTLCCEPCLAVQHGTHSTCEQHMCPMCPILDICFAIFCHHNSGLRRDSATSLLPACATFPKEVDLSCHATLLTIYSLNSLI